MFRALYAHKSKLPKYLSFEAGDKFTLIDTSISDQWFLAQNGMGQIGYVPFNYIKKIDAVTEQIVKFIDGSIEAIHLQAGADGAYTQEQRIILKKLMKHRTDVIKRATVREKSPKGVGSRRRPAPAPPVEKSASVDEAHVSGDRPSNLAIVGRSATISSTPSTSGAQNPQSEPPLSDNSKDSNNVQRKRNFDQNSESSHRSSVVSDTSASLNSSEHIDKEDVRKSQSVTSSIGQAPSIVSSASSISTDVDADASFSSENSSEAMHNKKVMTTPITGPTESATTHSDTSDASCNENIPFKKLDEEESSLSVNCSDQIPQFEQNIQEIGSNGKSTIITTTAESEELSFDSNPPPPPADVSDSQSAEGGKYDVDIDQYDLPPPPPDLQSGCVMEDYDVDGGGYFNSYVLPPAPDDEDGAMMGAGGGDGAGGRSLGEESDESDSLDLPAAKAIRECSCDDSHTTFDPEGSFTASGSLQLPKGRQLDPRRNKKRDVEEVHGALASSVVLSTSESLDPDQCERELKRLEQLQAHLGVTVTHADCEEMIGQFRHVSQLSHEESHFALLSAMSLLANNLPHIKPSLEILAHRFKMANQCPSTGKDYQCEDSVTLEGLVGQLDSVMNDSQQRGHYLADDLDDIIDIITTLSDTLSKAKHCVSVAAIQNDNYAMIEIIARYYQMETRWLIHSCLLQLVEAICHIHPQAITEFLYSQLPLELVAEMQQHSNDDIRFLQVARSLGIVFMRRKASPHKLTITMDLHFFIWLLGMIEGFNERGRHDDVEMLVALVCSYHLQHRDDPQNPVTEALKMAQGHALLECALSFLSKHDDPTRLLNSGIAPKINSVVLLLTHLYDSSDTSDLLYTNDVDALIGIFQEVFRDLSTTESLHRQMLKLLYNFLRCYPDTVSIKASVSSRLGCLLLDMNDKQGLARKILEHNRHIFEE